MGDMMTFPASVEEFMEQYKMTDTEHVYSNGTEYVPIYRMKQWFEHCRNQQFPAADVAPVRHGRWICIRKGYEEYECSVCHGMDSNCSDYYADHVVTEQEYCPNCGAKMDGELNE